MKQEYLDVSAVAKKTPVNKGAWPAARQFGMPVGHDEILHFELMGTGKIYLLGDDFFNAWHKGEVYRVNESGKLEKIQVAEVFDAGLQEVIRVWDAPGLTTAQGADWRAKRDALNPVFLKQNVEKFLNPQIEAIESFIATSGLQEIASNNQQVNMDDFLIGIYFYMMTQALLPYAGKYALAGVEINEARQTIFNTKTMFAVFPAIAPILHFFTKGEMKNTHARGKLEELLTEAIQTYRNQTTTEESVVQAKNLLDALLPLMDNGVISWYSLLETLIETGLIAAITTSSSLTNFILATLSITAEQSGSWLQLLRSEISKVNLNDQEQIAAYINQEDTWLNKIVQEALRLYNPTSVFMDSIGEDIVFANKKLGAVRFPAGSTLAFSRGDLARDKSVWGPNADVFDPSRFEMHVIGQQSTLAYPAYDANGEQVWYRVNAAAGPHQPFSAGPRNCIGKEYALQQIKLVLIKLLSQFDLNFENIKDLAHKLGEKNSHALSQGKPLSVQLISKITNQRSAFLTIGGEYANARLSQRSSET